MRKLLALTIVLAMPLSALPARADAYDAAMARAVAAKEKAIDANDITSWEEALRLFEEADALRSTAESQYEIAGAAAHLKEDDVAVQAYEASIALGLSGKPKEKAQAFLDQNVPAMARLGVVGPAGAAVYVGTRRRGTLPLPRPLVVFAGSVKLRVVSGAKQTQEDVTLKAGESRTLEAKLDVEPPPKGPPPAPPVARPVEDTGSGARTLGWTLIVSGGLVAVAGLGTGLYASSSVASHRDALAALCDKPLGTDDCAESKAGKRVEAQDEVDAIATMKGVRVVGYVALSAGLTTVIIGTLRLVTAPSPASTSGRFAPTLVIGRSTLGFALSGAF